MACTARARRHGAAHGAVCVCIVADDPACHVLRGSPSMRSSLMCRWCPPAPCIGTTWIVSDGSAICCLARASITRLSAGGRAASIDACLRRSTSRLKRLGFVGAADTWAVEAPLMHRARGLAMPAQAARLGEPVTVIHRFEFRMCNVWYVRFALNATQTRLAVGNMKGDVRCGACRSCRARAGAVDHDGSLAAVGGTDFPVAPGR